MFPTDECHSSSSPDINISVCICAGSGGVMGPPRLPGPHQMDPSAGHMMPPPSQNQGYPNIPYGAPGPYRNAQPMPPYGSFPNQVCLTY